MDATTTHARIFYRAAPALILLALAPTSSWAQARAEAALGSPFGAGRIELQLPANHPDALAPGALLLQDRQKRVFYPAVFSSNSKSAVAKDIFSRTRRPLGQLIGNLLDDSGKFAVYFLFEGDGPLELTRGRNRLCGSTSRRRPSDGLRASVGRLVEGLCCADRAGKKADYPPVVENYLQTMLSRRLGLPSPASRGADAWQGHFEQQLGLQLDTESIRVAMQQERIAGLAHVARRPSCRCRRPWPRRRPSFPTSRPT